MDALTPPSGKSMLRDSPRGQVGQFLHLAARGRQHDPGPLALTFERGKHGHRGLTRGELKVEIEALGDGGREHRAGHRLHLTPAAKAARFHHGKVKRKSSSFPLTLPWWEAPGRTGNALEAPKWPQPPPSSPDAPRPPMR